jgi:hypothetical protein
MKQVLALLVALLAAVAAIFYFLRPRAQSPSVPLKPPPLAAPPSDLALAHAPAPPRPARDGGARTTARTILSAPWGSGAGQLGRRANPESVTEGPMSFLVDKSGVLVLDNVNARLARFDAHGKPLAPIALPNEAAQDVAHGPRGSVAVLDRLRDKGVTLYGSDGKKLLTVPLGGASVPDPGGVTGLFTDGAGDVYAEYAHAATVPLIDGDGNADSGRRPVPGRPTRSGQRLVSAGIADRQAGTARVAVLDARSGSPVWDATVSFGAPIMYIALVDADAADDVVIAAHTGHEASTPPYRIEDETLAAIALSPSGDELGRMTQPAPPPPEEAFRDLWLGDDGTLYWMRRSTTGVQVEAYRLF